MGEINLDNAELFADSARGIYIPQHFAESVNREMLSGVSDLDLDILRHGPEHSEYWDAWCDVLDNAVLYHLIKGECSLYQDGDLWVIVNSDQD